MKDEYWNLKEQIHQEKINALCAIKTKIADFSTDFYEIKSEINTEFDRERMTITVFFPKEERELDKITDKTFKSLQYSK